MILGPIGVGLKGIGDFLGFEHGGVVPGPTGSPQLAVVHGGETITPPGGGSSGLTIQINAGTIVADQYSVDEFARKIDEALFRRSRRKESYFD